MIRLPCIFLLLVLWPINALADAGTTAPDADPAGDMAEGLGEAIGNGLDAAVDAVGDAAGEAAAGLGAPQDDGGDGDD